MDISAHNSVLLSAIFRFIYGRKFSYLCVTSMLNLLPFANSHRLFSASSLSVWLPILFSSWNFLAFRPANLNEKSRCLPDFIAIKFVYHECITSLLSPPLKFSRRTVTRSYPTTGSRPSSKTADDHISRHLAYILVSNFLTSHWLS